MEIMAEREQRHAYNRELAKALHELSARLVQTKVSYDSHPG